MTDTKLQCNSRLRVGSTGKNGLILLLSIGILVVLMLVKVPESIRFAGSTELTGHGQIVLAVLVFALVLWMTEALPFHITGLLTLVLLALFNVEAFKDIVKDGFGNDIAVFFIGVLILSAFISKSGLGKRISVFILSKTGNRTTIIVLGFLVVGMFISMWITEMAAAAILMPLGRALLEEEKVTPLKSNFGKALMIACAWGPVIGGVATPAGCGANPVAIGFLRDMAGINLSFLDWMIFGVPSAILLIIPSWLVLILFYRPEMKTLSRSKEAIQAEYKNYPPMSREEITTISILGITIVLWLTTPLLEKWMGISIPISLPVILLACMFFLPGVSKIKWAEVQREIPWSGILLLVTGVSLGMTLYKSGAAEWLSILLLGGIGSMHPFVQVLTVVLITSVLKVVFSSNTVTATVLIPIVLALSKNLGLDPLTIALPAGMTSSLAFILVTSSPTNVIPYSAGYFSIRDFAKPGIVLTVFVSFIVTGVIYIIGSLTHLY